LTARYTKADVSDPKKVITTGKDCKITDMKSSGYKVTWTRLLVIGHAYEG
jgi:hypothetical protein